MSSCSEDNGSWRCDYCFGLRAISEAFRRPVLACGFEGTRDHGMGDLWNILQRRQSVWWASVFTVHYLTSQHMIPLAIRNTSQSNHVHDIFSQRPHCSSQFLAPTFPQRRSLIARPKALSRHSGDSIIMLLLSCPPSQLVFLTSIIFCSPPHACFPLVVDFAEAYHETWWHFSASTLGEAQ